MSDCQVVRMRLGRFLDGELSPQEVARMEAHLRGCPGCHQELRALQALSASLDALVIPPVPAGTVDSIMARIRRNEASAPRSSGVLDFWKAWPLAMRLAAAGTAVAACLIGLTLGSASSGTRPVQGQSEMAWVALESGATLTSAYMGTPR